MWIFFTWVACIIIFLTGEFLLIKSHDRSWKAGIRELQTREFALRTYNLCERMKQSAAMLQVVIHEPSFVPLVNGNVDIQGECHAASLTEAQKIMAEVETQLLIDPTAKPFREKYTELWNTFNEYIITYLYEPPGIWHAKKTCSLEQTIDTLALEVRLLADNHLERLDTRPLLTEIPVYIWSSSYNNL